MLINYNDDVEEGEAGRGPLQKSGARVSGRRWRWGQVPDDRVGVITADVTLTGACALARKERVLWATGSNMTLNAPPASLRILRKGAKQTPFLLKIEMSLTYRARTIQFSH